MTDSQTTPTSLRPVKRYIASNDPITGKSIYVEAPGYVYSDLPGFGTVARTYATPSLPIQLNNEDLRLFRSTDEKTSHTRGMDLAMPVLLSQSPTGPVPGVNINVLELAPGAVGHWQRTILFDVAICVAGELIHDLDGGQAVHLHPG